ncbi:MAG: hypothetical protein HPY61_00460 [Methanotrichaceae archaeon]|nr:hypothetical protein [Methanotrichaceae archaeon]
MHLKWTRVCERSNDFCTPRAPHPGRKVDEKLSLRPFQIPSSAMLRETAGEAGRAR